MMRLVTCICVLTIAISCIFAMSTPSPAVKPSAKSPTTRLSSPKSETDAITVFLTGNEFGAMKPCGCSGAQLGGLDRRSAVLNSVPPSKRLIVDTGSFVEGDSEQDIIKFSIIIQAFGLLGYDLVNLTRKDIEIAQNLGLLDSISSLFNIISAEGGRLPYERTQNYSVPAKFTRQLPLKEKTITVTIAAFDAESTPIEQAKKLFASRPGPETVNILILNRCDDDIVASVARMETAIDCLVCPAESDEPMVIDEPNKPGEPRLVITTGRYGKYVGKLEITDARANDKLTLSFSAVEVTEDLPQEESLVELYKDYQRHLKETNLLEKYPRFTLPNGLEYVGSKHCHHCHSYEYKKWSTQAHAHAYATLERLGSQYDPECVVCHVVGMEYESGFVSEEQTSHLKNVGCENCHGPGSKRIKSTGKSKTAEPRSSCTDCHTPDHSVDYAENKQSFFEEIIHWREPNTANNVK